MECMSGFQKEHFYIFAYIAFLCVSSCDDSYAGGDFSYLSMDLWMSLWVSIPINGKVVIPMIFLSTLLRKQIYDIEGHKVGVLRDVCVSLNDTFPTVTALVITTSTLPGNHDIMVPWAQVDNIEEPKLYLTVKQVRLASYEPRADELLL